MCVTPPPPADLYRTETNGKPPMLIQPSTVPRNTGKRRMDTDKRRKNNVNSDIHSNPRHLQCEYNIHPPGHRRIKLLSIQDLYDWINLAAVTSTPSSCRDIILFSIHDLNNWINLAAIATPSSWSGFSIRCTFRTRTASVQTLNMKRFIKV